MEVVFWSWVLFGDMDFKEGGFLCESLMVVFWVTDWVCDFDFLIAHCCLFFIEGREFVMQCWCGILFVQFGVLIV